MADLNLVIFPIAQILTALNHIQSSIPCIQNTQNVEDEFLLIEN